MTTIPLTMIAAYIQTAPSAGQPHLRRIYAILKSVAPYAEEAIKWNIPFFIEPRFLFAFSAHKAHLGFAPSAEALQHFEEALMAHTTTKELLKIRYDEPLPEELIRKIAEYRAQVVRESDEDSFWVTTPSTT